MTRETEDLATHVEICAIRYQAIEDKFHTVDTRLDNIDRNLSEIKLMINAQRDSKFTTMVATAGTVIVGLLGVLGYLVAHLK